MHQWYTSERFWLEATKKAKRVDADVEDEDEKSNREDTSMSSAPQEGSEY